MCRTFQTYLFLLVFFLYLKLFIASWIRAVFLLYKKKVLSELFSWIILKLSHEHKCILTHRSLDGAHGQLHSVCQRRQNCTLCGASVVQKCRSQHGGQVRGFTDVFQVKMFIGFSTQYVPSYPYWYMPNNNTPDLTWTREEEWEVVDQISFDGSRYVSLPCGSIMHHSAPYSVCIFVCFVWNVLLWHVHVQTCIRQTDKQTH